MGTRFCRVTAVLLAGFLVGGVVAPLSAQQVLDTPSIRLGATGWGKQQLVITAGASGAPGGFTVLWADAVHFAANGYQWFPDGHEGQQSAEFYGEPTLNVFGGESPTFQLAPGASITVEIGDLFDESGVRTAQPNELEGATQYYFCVFANPYGGAARSGLSGTEESSTLLPLDCTYTVGYWKTHPGAWPVTNLSLGNVTYDRSQLLTVLNQPVHGNGLVSLCHQLIAAKLNVANGAEPQVIAAVILDADALIGDLVVPPIGFGFLAPDVTAALTQQLDDYNNGVTGPGHCDEVGACCLSDGSCLTTTPSNCAVHNGTYEGNGTSCDPSPCPPPPPTGACCLDAGGCLVLTQSECAEHGVAYMGDGVPCTPSGCPPLATEKSSWGLIKHHYR